MLPEQEERDWYPDSQGMPGEGLRFTFSPTTYGTPPGYSVSSKRQSAQFSFTGSIPETRVQPDPAHVRTPYQVVRDFEAALCEYTGARFAVATNSCTNALLLACLWNQVGEVTIPKFTYNGVVNSIINAGGSVKFWDYEWTGRYQLRPYPIWDSARRLRAGMYLGGFECLSFAPSKVLKLSHGGAILHDDPIADQWLRKARFDGRTEGVHPKDDDLIIGHRCHMYPEIAAQGLRALSFLPTNNPDLPNSDYADLSQKFTSLPNYLGTTAAA